MIRKKIDSITGQDLEELINNSVSEGKTIEYKQSLSVAKDSEKKEFLADVSSFANASGGDLIYGMRAEHGIPKSLDGISIQNVDAEIARLENIIRDGIDPRISFVTIKPVTISAGNIVLIIRISKSWNIPHRVSFQGHDKFYSRNSNGKHPLDVGELRTMFNLSGTLEEKIKRFRENRISSIIANESAIFLPDGAKIVLHLIPIIVYLPF